MAAPPGVLALQGQVFEDEPLRLALLDACELGDAIHDLPDGALGMALDLHFDLLLDLP